MYAGQMNVLLGSGCGCACHFLDSLLRLSDDFSKSESAEANLIAPPRGLLFHQLPDVFNLRAIDGHQRNHSSRDAALLEADLAAAQLVTTEPCIQFFAVKLILIFKAHRAS